MKPQRSLIDYHSLFDNLLDGIAYCRMVFDKQRHPVNFVYLQVSNNFETLTGLKAVLGRKVTEVIPGLKQSNPELFEVYGRVAKTGKPERIEVYIKVLKKWFLVSAYSSKRGYFTAVVQNITVQKQLEEKLENEKVAAGNVFADLNAEKIELDKAKAKEEAILGSIADGFMALDKGGNIIFMNEAAEKMLGYSSREAIGRKWSQILRLEDEKGNAIPLEKGAVYAALTAGAVTTTEITANSFYYSRKDGTKFPVSRSVSPIILNKQVIGAVNIFRDITRDKDIDRAKTEFVSLASHQLRTPTTAIGWYAKMLMNEEVGTLNETQKKYLRNIYDGNKWTAKLVGSLLNVSRIELGAFIIQPETVSLPEICRNIINELRPQITAKKISVRENYQDNLPPINADNKLVYIILQNLLVNAISYTAAGGEITVSLSKKNQEKNSDYLISVADTGIGIPRAEQDKIFTKLFRAQNAKEMASEGTGLGLYIVRSILEHTSGHVWFESEENKGSVFHVSLPAEGMKPRKGDRGLL